jgi:hypothetical protein
MVLTGDARVFQNLGATEVGRRHRTKLIRHGDGASEIGADLCVSWPSLPARHSDVNLQYVTSGCSSMSVRFGRLKETAVLMLGWPSAVRRLC